MKLCANILANSHSEDGSWTEGVDPLSTEVVRGKARNGRKLREPSVRSNWVILPQKMCPNQILLGQIFVSANVILVRGVGMRRRVFIVVDTSLITAGRGRK